jgi:hypothetical protein
VGITSGMDIETTCALWEALWNERSSARRMALLAEICEEGVTLVDPGNDVAGHRSISDAIGGVQEQTPGMVFRLCGPADAHHHVVRVPWETTAGDTRRAGIDVFVLGAEGRISTALGFKDV